MNRYIRPNDLQSRFGFSRVTAWRWANNPEKAFPMPMKLTDGITLYDLDAVEAWLARQFAEPTKARTAKMATARIVKRRCK